MRETGNQNAKALADLTEAEERRRAAQEEMGKVSEQLVVSQAALEEHRQAQSQRFDALRGVEDDFRRFRRGPGFEPFAQ